MIERVHVVFKTHLDIGFTDLAARVVDRYIDDYIPAAIRLAETLEREGGQARFVWTTGSWLIDEYLRRADPERRARMERAIAQGHIVWHGLPFTTHTELMDGELFKYGLSLAKRLDERFGRRTVAAKMTDVPGHTRAIVPYLAEAGIRYLHLGVNPASKKPDVPDLFVWRGAGGSETIVNYAGNYGNVCVVPELADAMAFAHTGDNCGPPSAEEIRATFAELAARFPGAEIRASTMDAFANGVMAMQDRLPVVEEEIGDTWIHGAASDPGKLARFRELQRLRTEWLGQGLLDAGSRGYDEFSNRLMLVAEHTWGMDEKKHLTDFRHYAKADFAAARRADAFRAADTVSDRFKYIGEFFMEEPTEGGAGDAALKDSVADIGPDPSTDSGKRSDADIGTDSGSKRETEAAGRPTRSYSRFESSWREQRDYLRQAVDTLDADKRGLAAERLRGLEPQLPEAHARELIPGIPYRFGDFTVSFRGDGSIGGLVDPDGKTRADEAHPLGAFAYESFGAENYDQWFREYVENRDRTYAWADADFGKPGIELVRPLPVHREFAPVLTSLTANPSDGLAEATALLAMPEPAVRELGAPRLVTIQYRFHSAPVRKLEIVLQWFDKPANRLPEAAWLTISPKVNNPNRWEIDKLGEFLSPLDVVRHGNRQLHAVQSGARYRGSDGALRIRTLDAPVVAPGQRRLLRFDETFAPPDGGFHFLLHNNVWGTNYPMWYEEDARFRFELIFDQ